MKVTQCDWPQTSLLERDKVVSADLRDSFQAPLEVRSRNMPQLFEAIFGHHPAFAKLLLLARNKLMHWLGYEVARSADIRAFQRRETYKVGDTIGPWPLFYIGEDELIAGRDNGHLDFRVSLLRIRGPQPRIVVSTICNAHNAFGRVYLKIVGPFHRFGVPMLLRRAVASGRI
jgi:hypothetical protein